MTDEYTSGSGHPTPVDPSGRTPKYEEYDDEKHGYAIVICTRRTQYCKNYFSYVKDYARHLQEYHNLEIDPVQERLMKSSAMKFRKDKFVWAPFRDEITETLYNMHMQEIWDEVGDK